MGVEIIFKIAAIGILTTVCGQILKKSEREEMATLVTLAGVVIALTMVVSMIAELFETMQNLFLLY